MSLLHEFVRYPFRLYSQLFSSEKIFSLTFFLDPSLLCTVKGGFLAHEPNWCCVTTRNLEE